MATTQKGPLLAALLVMLVLLVPIGVGMGIVHFVLEKPASEARRVVLRATPPRRVREGETFELTVAVHNHTDQSVNLTGIDLASAYLDGFVLLRTRPAYVRDEEGPVFRSFVFDQKIEPGENTTVVFRMQAMNSGDWAGDIDATVSGTTGMLTTRAETQVTVTGNDPADGPNDGPPLIIQPNLE